MHWSIFVLLMGAVAGTRAQPTDSAVDSACPPPRCGINEHLESNSNKCQITCSNMKYEAVMGACAPTSDCYCNKGYVRDEEGICIKREDCPPPQCPKGEVWNDCGSSCPPSCDNRNNTCLVCTMQCVSGCFCAGDTVRAPDGSCVKPKNCPPRTCSGPNEEFVNCPPTCPSTEKCENLWSKKPCTPIDCCEPKCRCKPGFYRNDQNVCVSAKECSLSRCPKGEVWNDCGSSCPPSCDSRNNTCLVCTKQCVSGCFCAGDTVRAPDGSCVKPKDCPPRTCSGPNEEFVNCPPTCPRTEKCENLWSKKPCTPIDCCEPKCRCKPGFYRNDQNVCVSAKECSLSRCPKGEVWNDCGSSCPPSCDNRNNTCLVCTDQCVSGCFCAGDTVRAPDGSCVKPKDCPPRTCCGPNEEFVNCPPTCPRTEKCENLWSKKPCTPIDCCEPKCRCKPGFYRNGQNVCVSAKECSPPQCPKGEVWNDCGSSCPPSCDNRNNTCLVCTEQCVSGCFCVGDSVRAPDGSCVKPKNCPPRTCSGPNEEFVNCPPTCPRTEKCENLWSKKPCTPIDCCEPKCRCKPGFYRNDQNVCVSAKECSLSRCPKGEVWNDCGSSCPPSCDNRNNTCLVCTDQCVSGCFCAGDTVRAPDGSCVKPKDCPPRTCCGPNEEFVNCPPTCPRTEKCENLWSKKPCTPIDCCEPKCRCKPGFYRNGQNVCVRAKECSPPQCPKGEVWNDCGSSCPPSCDSRNNTCLVCTMQCVSGCFCAGDTVRGPDGSCVKPKDCPRRTCSGPNEEFVNCPPTCPRTEKCENLWSKKPCTPIDCCEPKCRCKPGFYRNDQNVCVSAKECSLSRCPKGEVWNDCGSSCPPSCDNRNNTCLVCTDQCVSGCFCVGDTVRAPDGSCVKPKNCPRRTCSGPNEEFVNCPPTCPRTEKCENLWSKTPCTPIDCCEPKCRCKPGFYRNDQNVCVSAKECSPPQCPKGEVWNDCGSSCPPSCDNKNNTCLVCTMQCVSGCFCAGDTVRGPDGSCVKPKDCPRRTCSDPNEEFVNCPPTCPRTEKCENLWSKKPCTPIDCCEPKCRCKPGFYRNDQNVCVSAKECCPPQCPKGEVWNDCGSSCPPSCDNRNNTCLVCTKQCVSGCFCTGDTVRAPDGSCVKPKNCPPRKCSGPNEEFVNCPPTCPRTEKCENLWSKKPCTPIDCCEPKCRCKPGFYRNDQNVCVSAKECSSLQCPNGEVWNDCGSSCPPSCDNRNNTCLVCTMQCVSGCFCAGDTVRAPDGSCVKPKNCPPRTCSGPNEEFVNCPPTCPRTEKCENLWSKKPCTPIDCCEPKCRCKSGFYRNDKDVCVSAKECSSAQCGEGEVYSDCNSSCSELCEDRGNTCLGCAAVCVPGCYCAGNTFRAPDGTCVKPENCPRRTCGRNEVFDKCPPTCPRTEACKNLWSKEPCTPIDCCRPSCRCKPGYYRNKQKDCVSAHECGGSSPCDE